MTTGSTRLRVSLDGTPLLGARTGVGRYVAELVGALSGDLTLSLTAAPFTVRTGGRPQLPDGVRWRHVPAPARLLRRAWLRTGVPPVELLAGRCDVFHATNFVLPPTASARGVVTVHDLAFLRFPDTVAAASLAYRELVPAGLRRAAAVLTPSEAVAAEVRAEYRLEDDRVVATPLGVDPGWADAAPLRAAARRALGVPEDYLLFVGTREPRKGLDVLTRAHAAARRDCPDAVPPLVLAGPAGWGTEPAPGGAVLTGYVEEPVLQSLVAGARALVLPSRYEGFGLPVLEALATGTPVVASDIPAVREVAGDLAVYAAAGDPESLAQALLLTCSGGGAGTRQQRREGAAAFTWADCARRTADVYRRA